MNGNTIKGSRGFEYELSLVKECLTMPLSESLVKTLLNARSTAWIASGLSSFSAEFGRRMFLNKTGIPATLFTPLDFVQSNTSQYLPILVSYRGKNRDIKSVAKKIVQNPNGAVVLLTGFADTPVERQLLSGKNPVDWFHLPAHKEEKRFISVLPTMTLAALGYRLAQLSGKDYDDTSLVEGLDWIYSKAKITSQRLVKEMTKFEGWDKLKWIIIGGGSSAPSLLGWQTSLMEAGLTSPVIIDIKDFSHGKYLSALREKNIGLLLLSDPSTSHLTEIIRKRFDNVFTTVSVTAESENEFAFWEHLFIVFLSLTELSDSLGFNIRKPPKPKIVQSWTNWGEIKI